ncbi:hypothetical protein ACFCZ3_20080 [Cellulosimicrobium cellulans]|uniref:hypothetical protein n=1 Tax=Cellulosimicrobium cellulans TaxID=1710 RepID=UPI0035E32674
MPSRLRLTGGPHRGAVVDHPDDVPPVLLHLARHATTPRVVPEPDDLDDRPEMYGDAADADAYARDVDEPDAAGEWPYSPLEFPDDDGPTLDRAARPVTPSPLSLLHRAREAR